MPTEPIPIDDGTYKAAEATKTAASPTSEWNAATSWGIAVIAIFLAIVKPIEPPIPIPTTSNIISKFLCEFLINRWLRDQLGLSFVKSAATGGAALGPDTFKFFVDIGIPLRQLYGQTEQIGAYTIHRKNDIDYDSVGYPFESVEIKIEMASENPLT